MVVPTDFASCRAAVIGLALLAACSSPSPTVESPPPPSPVTMSPSSGWSGSILTVHSQRFRGADAGIVLHLGDSLLTMSRVDDTTLAATIPAAMPAGMVTPSIEVGGESIPFSPMTIYGLSGSHTFSNYMASTPLTWAIGGHVVVLGGTVGTVPGTYQVAIYDLDGNTESAAMAILNPVAYHFPGPSYQPGVVVVRGHGDTLETWQVLPTPTLLSRFARHPSTTWGAMQVGASDFIDVQKYYVTTPAGCFTLFQPQGLFIAPTNDHATFTTLGTQGHFCGGVGDELDGVPVFDIPSGNLAYTVSGLKAVYGVSFSPDGTLLLMAGANENDSGPGRLALMQAASGTILADTSLAGAPGAVALDVARKLVFAQTRQAGHAVILVLDQGTLRAVGQFEVPDGPLAWQAGSVLVLGGNDALYLFSGNTSWRFTLPSVPAAVRGPR